MLVNALSYGLIIPLLYPYAEAFGLSSFMVGLMFSSFSIAQFLATPIIGRLSDRYGRKPLLVFSLFGTGASLLLFAYATTPLLLFTARILDGITGGNNSVAQAVIADQSKGKERAKYFGILGAVFGVGFLVGPALGGILGKIALNLPFIVGGIFSFVSAILTAWLLPETNASRHQQQTKKEGLFQLHKLHQALRIPIIGHILLVVLLASAAHNSFVFGFQSYSVDVLRLSSNQVGLIYSLIGLLMVVMQAAGIKLLLKVLPNKQSVLILASLSAALVMLAFGREQSILIFTIISGLYMVSFAPIMVMNSALISEHSREEDQGGMLGINQAYLSLGQILGPLLAGGANFLHHSASFYLAGGLFLLNVLIVSQIRPSKKLADI